VLGTDPEEVKSYVHQKVCVQICITALFSVSKKAKNIVILNWQRSLWEGDQEVVKRSD
jgi:hypothetical protein